MALTGWSTSNYLRRLFQVYDTYPFLISIWANAPAADTTSYLIQVGTSGTAFHRRGALYADDTNHANLVSTDGASNQFAIINLPLHPVGSWFHLAGELIASNDRAILMNGTNRAEDTGDLTINASDSVYIGVYSAVALPWYATGGIAEASIWNCTGMTSGNMDSLAGKLYNGGVGGTGGNPLNITAEAAQPWSGKLVAYWIDAANTLTDLAGHGHTLSMVGTLTNFASHPTIEAAGDPVGSIRPRTTVSIVP